MAAQRRTQDSEARSSVALTVKREQSRMRARIFLSVLVAVVLGLSGAGPRPVSSLAAFVDRSALGANTVSTTTLGSPGLLTAVPLCGPNGKPRVDLDWGAASSGGTPVYKVYRSKTTNTAYASVGETTALTYQDGGVQQSVTYWYKIQSTIGGWTGGFSNEVSVLTPDVCL